MTVLQSDNIVPAAAQLDRREEHVRIPGPQAGLSLFLRYLPPAPETSPGGNVVAYVHGGTFRSALSIAHRPTYLMHLEENRFSLYREAETFLNGGDQPREVHHD